MKVALVAQKYPPIVGGGETHLQNLADGLAEHGCDVTVLTSDPGSDPGRYRNPAVRIEYIDGLWAACESLSCKDAVVSLYAHLSGQEWDVVHVFNHVPAMIMSWIRAVVTSPLFLSLFETHVPGERVFDLWGEYDLEKTIQRSLIVNLAPDRIICGSQAYRRWALGGGCSDERIRVVPFGTETQRFANADALRPSARGSRGLDGEFVFLVPARPVPRKRIEDAVLALAQVRDKHPEARVMLTLPKLTANSAYVDRVKQLIADNGLEGAVLWELGVGWQEMPEVYATADAVLLPSSHEGFGIALIEGMSAGRPVVTSDVEGHDEIVTDGETGWLYPSGDVEALGRCMEAVLTGSGTKEIVERARDLAFERFDVSAMVEGHYQAYAELVG